MDLQESLLAIGALIVVAKLLEGIFRRFGLNSIIAYAATGVFLGPVTGLVEPGTDIEIVLSIGIFIFFFLIGLEELDIRGFLSAIRGRLFLASVLCVTISLLVSLAVTTDFLFDLGLDLSFTEALALAGVLSLSSLGVVAKVLIDEGRLREAVGVQIFTAVVIAELLALFVVGFAISEHFYAGDDVGHLNPLTVATVIGQILIFTCSDVVYLHESSAEGNRPASSLPAGAAALVRGAAGRTVPRRRGSRRGRPARLAGRPPIWRRALDAALPGPP